MERRGTWGLAALLAVACAAPAAAELFRCQGPDGRVVYTDQKETCPGADPFEPSGVVHSAPTPTKRKPPPASRRGATASADAEAAQAQLWKNKKLSSENELQTVLQRRGWLQQYLAHCNRGGLVTTRDDAGIKQVVDCDEIRREYESLEAREQAARAYLDEGLRDECRKAGCLPGWIR